MVKKHSQQAVKQKGKSQRAQRGNMLVLSTAITVGLVMALLFFALNYARLLGSNNEQRTATENAALEAAKKLSEVVIEDDNFGYIGLSDYAPTGKYTKAEDNYCLSVRSINDILNTTRLDLIIADRINDPQMKLVAERDYIRATQAKTRLVDVLKDALLRKPRGAAGISPPYKNRDGKELDIYRDAEEAYTRNRVRMAERSYYVPGSLVLTLGSVPDAPTNAKVPEPYELASISEDDQQNGCYKSFRNIPYGGKSFVFAPTTFNISLVDPRKFQEGGTSPAIVKASARQYISMWGSSGNNIDNVVESVACAEPACVTDPRPAPGALMISFYPKLENRIRIIRDILRLPEFNIKPVQLKQGEGNDYPRRGGRLDPVPGQETVAMVWSKVVFYNWLKRAGPKARIDSVMRFQGAVLGSGANIFEFNQNGEIIQFQVPTDEVPDLPVAHKQLTASVPEILTGVYDLDIYDYVSQPGKIAIHGGETLPLDLLDRTGRSINIVTNIGQLDSRIIARLGIDYGSGGSGCGGIENADRAVRARKRKKSKPYDFPIGDPRGEPRMQTYLKDGLAGSFIFTAVEDISEATL